MLIPFSHIHFRAPFQSLRKAYKRNMEQSPIFQEGLYLSSPEFWQEYQRRDELKEKEQKKLALSHNKYWLRSTVRCTPYGTFAGSAMVRISDEETKLTLASESVHRRNLRLDMNYMAEIVNALVQIPSIRLQLLFVPNNTLYFDSNMYRYAEYYIKNNTRHYQLTAVEKTPYLEKIFNQAKQGATLNELILMLMQDEEVVESEASDYISELWLSQLLIPVLEPTVTGNEPLDQIITQLEKLSGVEEILSKLKEIQYLLSHAEEGVDYYKEIESKLEQLELGINVPKNTIQADLFLQTKSANINTVLVEEIVHQINDLKAFARQNKNSELEDFKTKFLTRYEEKQIPLALALDGDLGIGYAGVSDQSAGGGEWVDGLAIQGGTASGDGAPFDYLQQFSLSKYQDWLANGKDYIEIKETEIASFKEQTKNYKFSNSMFLMGSLMKQKGALHKENFTFDVSSFGGPSAANLLGRFTHGDEQLCQLAKDILEKEEQEYPNAIYAEIAHLPQARIGNILLRPVLRKYEIPYVGLSGIAKANQIMMDDLYVSVKNNEVVLFSKILNKRVIPRLTTAHNFGYNSLPVYKFLCDLQGQGIAYPNVWDWGHLSTLKHLPKVVYKNLILRKATWKIEERAVADLPKEKEAYKSYFESFRNKLKMPARVVYKEGDNELLIDFNEIDGIVLFLHYLKRYKNILLEEFLFTEDNCVVHNEQGEPFTNELIIPLYDAVTTNNEPAHNTSVSGFSKAKRSFSPYSEWLYFKVYCGAKSAEKILATTIFSFIERGMDESLFEQFFFIRYRDESGGHFRIRFKNNDVQRQLNIYHQFVQSIQSFIDNGTIERIMLDTYNRELERYTPHLIEASETLFYNDSVAILRFINLLDGLDGAEQYRMVFAMRGIDMLLSDFNLDLEQKGLLMKQLQSNFFKEFGAHPFLQKQLNDRYRKHQQFLTNHLDVDKDEANEIEEAVGIFSIRSEMNKSVIEKILEQLKSAEDSNKIFGLLRSYIHMFMNRLYIAQQRKYELVVYHFLERYYTSKMAIAKKEQKNAIPHL